MLQDDFWPCIKPQAHGPRSGASGRGTAVGHDIKDRCRSCRRPGRISRNAGTDLSGSSGLNVGGRKMKAVSLGNRPGAGFVPDGEPAGGSSRSRGPSGRLKGLSVKATLRLAFALLLMGTLAIGVFSLTQISRLNGSTRSIYDQGHVASRAAEEARGYVLRASRAQKMLLTSTTAKERDDLGNDIRTGLPAIPTGLNTLQQYVDASDSQAVAQQKKFATAVTAWSANLRSVVTLVKAQPLDLSPMNSQVRTPEV